MSRSGLDIARCAADDLRAATVGASATARRNSAAPTTATVSADCIVVGAGVVGCALAYRLAEDGRSVVLLGMVLCDVMCKLAHNFFPFLPRTAHYHLTLIRTRSP